MGGRNCLKNDKFNSFNKAVKVRRLSAARLHKTPFGLRPLHGFVPPHFASPGLCFAKPLFGLAKRQ